ncbi:hypothetical protein RN607_01100 [Demequina capsici]|uniref:Uncharacterized protein n=1 Tax=Demequina capsici TaxID=3075620 RepID=A0AA96F6G0_9MICO|nr:MULTISPECIES: hypothetical protein [unclassified Demequina]WNM24723.1 hypothetical protein RN606_00815 [Demequina sp. OYTSA14]WNM27632.1 hypothetical protein RN607_01100 [Demequina sp. PMTSA13]
MSEAAEATLHVRERALTAPALDYGAPEGAEAWLAGIDIAFPDVVVTLICGWDGTTSLLMSTGGGIVGAGSHDEVSHAAHAFLFEAGAWVDELLPLPDLSFPELGRVRFFVRRGDRCVVGEAGDLELAEGRHDLAGLYSLAQAVVTQVRRTTRS